MRIFKSDRLDERDKGLEIIAKLKKENDKTLIIHYSCESFFNLEGRTPRVTSICVKNRGNNSTKTFSIHLQAQFHKKELCCITDEENDFLEKQMLKEFFCFLKNHQTHNWVHWNMRNSSYGFEAIANRYRILGGTVKEIEDQFKFDLPRILSLIYTNDFEDHGPIPKKGQLLNLALRNEISLRDALEGKGEAELFDNKEYLKLHMSTCRKVDVINEILTLEEKCKLKVKIGKVRIYGLTPEGIFEIVKNNWILFLIYSLVIFVIGIVVEPKIQDILGIKH
ncbi:hypothetical protein [Flavobacterium sp. LHD-85]|uniref:hypothetical protein n=1 Tax=Flavobacterium sp. LHD-85 TaxID=3071410 RepID=UPI0027E1FC82|nr:hypothetical protein [Flavobacterium sp. LHD-85]MDQ6529052.1 hypothetical protein [Flavobacterium sp. LHD-85]